MKDLFSIYLHFWAISTQKNLIQSEILFVQPKQSFTEWQRKIEFPIKKGKKSDRNKVHTVEAIDSRSRFHCQYFLCTPFPSCQKFQLKSFLLIAPSVSETLFSIFPLLLSNSLPFFFLPIPVSFHFLFLQKQKICSVCSIWLHWLNKIQANQLIYINLKVKLIDWVGICIKFNLSFHLQEKKNKYIKTPVRFQFVPHRRHIIDINFLHFIGEFVLFRNWKEKKILFFIPLFFVLPRYKCKVSRTQFCLHGLNPLLMAVYAFRFNRVSRRLQTCIESVYLLQI